MALSGLLKRFSYGPNLSMIKDIIADHFSSNPQAGCHATYPISRLFAQVVLRFGGK
jgi:hypothetical protein